MTKYYTGEEILQMQLPYQNYLVDQILPAGLFLLAGKPKIGKSWFVLQLGIAISTGQKFLGFDTHLGKVWYMCLEDTTHRIQNRLIDFEENELDNIKFSFESKSLSTGLLKELALFISEYPDTKLIIIDTLQKVRDVNTNGNAYGHDYKEINEFNHFVNETGVSILLVHHLRKAKSDDPFEEISGTTGIAGAVDGMFVLNSDRSLKNSVSLVATGRDIEQFEMKLQFNKDSHHWEVLDKSLESSVEDEVVISVIKLIKEIKEFESTATELSKLIKDKFDIDIRANLLSKKLKDNNNLLIEHGIELYRRRNGQTRTLILVQNSGTGVDDDGNDAILP